MEPEVLTESVEIASPSPYRRVLVTGGAGFIGSHLVRSLIRSGVEVLCFDKLTYAGHQFSLDDVAHTGLLHWCVASLDCSELLREALQSFRPQAILHLAAESHVDRSIDNPFEFVASNVLSTTSLVSEALGYQRQLSPEELEEFRLIQISTDEVFGSMDHVDAPKFNEATPYSPNSPYSASKGAADLILKSFRHTFGLKCALLYSSNNYGPFQHPEKFIPNSILCAKEGREIPVYGDGLNVRDWVHVSDHVDAIARLLYAPQERFADYAIGGTPLRNIDILKLVLEEMERVNPSVLGAEKSSASGYSRLVRFVRDRPGHDFKYEVDSAKIRSMLGWTPRVSLQQGIRETVAWYLRNDSWIERVCARKG